MKVTLEEAYVEACRALGEAIIRERILTKALQEARQSPSPGAILE